MSQLSRTQGLTSQQAQALLKQNGTNETQPVKRKSFLQKFISQFGDLMIIILLVSAALSFFVAVYSHQKQDLLEPIIIIAIVLVNAILGTVQEYKADKSLDALSKLTSPQTKVIRDDKIVVVDSKNLVVGDVCIFESGDIVTADCIVTSSQSAFVNQSAITGESVPVEKTTTSTSQDKDANKIYSGSFVTSGRCCAVVVKTGANTEIGKVAKMLSDEKQTLTPLQQKLKKLSKVIGMVCLLVCGVVMVVGFVKGVKNMQQGDTLTGVFIDVFLTSISLAVASIPEGLPAIVTVVLAKGIQRLAKSNALVKRLTAVEALGSASVICSDKTGTLTQNKMTLTSIFDGLNTLSCTLLKNDSVLLQQFCWCCDAVQNSSGAWIGDPTEIAVSSVTKQTVVPARLYEIPFDSTRKLMTVVVQVKGRYFAVTKGSLEAMKHAPNYAHFASQARKFYNKGLRVLALSVREVNSNFPRSSKIESQLDIRALFTLSDPPRSQVKASVAQCKSAGIRPVMITGDNAITATEIAKQIGIFNDGDMAIDGETLSTWTDEQLYQNVDKIAVYARVTSADKLRIVSCWQRKGQVVAMTGDGVNDAPALKNADIGCAMGSGTEVAKDASDIILLDDNFATIVNAVSLGRSVYNNIKKCISYLLTCNVGEVLFVFISLLLWDVSPLSAIQLLWLNLVTDSLPAFALGVYKQDTDVMQHAPKNKKENFLSGIGGKIIFGGILFAICTILAYKLGLSCNAKSASTMAFLTLSLSQLWFAFAVRNNKGILHGGTTILMTISIAVSVAMVLLVCFVPFLTNLFGLTTLSLHNYLIVLLLSIVPTFGNEIWLKACGIQSKTTNP